MSVRVLHGDCREVLRTLDAGSVSAVVTDPPAGISFMGRAWDGDKGGRDHWISWMQEIAAECLRVCKPGAHALVWALPRTSHWTATAWEDAGWVVRDRISHLFSSGFPKSLNVSVAIDKAAGAERARERDPKGGAPRAVYAQDSWTKANAGTRLEDQSATPEAARWSGWHTSLKPACEDWWLLRKPLSEPTVAQNVLAHGCGGLNIDACRVGTEGTRRQNHGGTGNPESWRTGNGGDFTSGSDAGRWPANICHDGSDEVEAAFAAFGERTSGKPLNRMHIDPGRDVASGASEGGAYFHAGFGDTGSASRFFFSGKATAEDRAGSRHPTIKPLSLMSWLTKLICPPGGTVLDPFAGSGTTLLAADRLGFDAIGIEQDAEYIADIHHRLQGDCPLFTEVA